MRKGLHQRTKKKIAPGNPSPFGATITSEGVNFALFSEHAESVYLLLFDDLQKRATDAIAMEKTEHTWHVMVKGIGAGQLYGYKVKGEYNPKKGFRFNEHKLLLDPYAKAMTGTEGEDEVLLLGYNHTSSKKDMSMDTHDSSPVAPKSIVDRKSTRLNSSHYS